MAGKPRLQTWFNEKLRRESTLCVLAAAGLLAAALLVSYVTYWAIYVSLVFLGVGGSFEQTHNIALMVMGTLFVVSPMVNRNTLETYEFATGDGAAHRIGVARLAGAGGLAPLAGGVQNAEAFFRFVLALLLAGPGILAHSIRMVRRAWRLARIDREWAGRLLQMMLKADRRVTFQTIQSRTSTPDLDTALSWFAEIDGVVVLTTDPAGLTMTPGLREEINEWRRASTDG